MGPVTDHSKMTTCPICGTPIQTSNLPEHLLADARMLRIIKATHPGWSCEDCEQHWRHLCGSAKVA
jgi:hypothetical protein